MKLGEKGEGLAVKFLKKNGYRIIQRNYKTSIGEIDIVARDHDVLAFVEVKARESFQFGQPFESINSSKQRKIANVATLYLKQLKDITQCRFDVVSISYRNNKPELRLIKDAFEL